MRKLLSIIIIALIACIVQSISAEGLLPSLTETVGVAMPSIGEALLRYPDYETESEDGSITEFYTNVSEADFNTFSVYLEEKGASLTEYHVENGTLIARIQAKGASFSMSYDSKSGEVTFTYPSGTFDGWTKNAEMHFDAGQKLLAEGNADEALKELLLIPQYNEYPPAEDLLRYNDKLIVAAATAAREAKFELFQKPGNIVAFGHYEQDNNTANGPEEIEWIVLDYDKKEQKALLLSWYGLDAMQYNTTDTDITWEECSLRTWLNSEFLNIAFSSAEQSAILMTNVDNSSSQGNSKWYTIGGNNTQDWIFLLSYAETNLYFNTLTSKNIKSRVSPTDYALAQGAYSYFSHRTEEGEIAGCWWLRSPGNHQDYVAAIDTNGSLCGCRVDIDDNVVRPAFWLNLESDFIVK